MRYKRALNKQAMEFLIDNGDWTNQELAKQLNTTPEIIASYKSKARKAGIKIPFQRSGKVVDVFKKIAKKKKEVVSE